MKVLQLCNKMPYPTIDGGCMAMIQLANDFLKLNYEVTTVALNTKKQFVEISSIPKDIIKKYNLIAFTIDTSINAVEAFKYLFNIQKSYNIDRFYTQEIENKIKTIIQNTQFDIIVFESIYMSPYFEVCKTFSKSKLILRSHNIENEIWYRKYENETVFLKKIYLNFLAKSLKNVEDNFWNKFDKILAISSNDKKYISSKTSNNVLLYPFIQQINDTTKKDFPSKITKLFHIGAMDWQPNINGINWFIENVFSKLVETNNEFELHLAGRNMSKSFIEKNENRKNVFLHGQVQSSQEFMFQNHLLVVPIFEGSGMRVKIIEAFSYNIPVLCNSIAIQGIEKEFRNKKTASILDSANDMIQFLKTINNNLELLKVQANTAYNFILENNNTSSILKEI
jgi:polysaccharide biosynthesis protein PslH